MGRRSQASRAALGKVIASSRRFIFPTSASTTAVLRFLARQRDPPRDAVVEEVLREARELKAQGFRNLLLVR